MGKVEKYHHLEIEPRWQKKWEEDGLYQSDIRNDRPKYYALTMLPYPSGDLHIGHWYAFTPSDAFARYKRMSGFNVLFPMGFDAFGLPAENAAIKRKIHPFHWTIKNIENMRMQLRSMGATFDWRREAVSCLPGFYRWTQWFFLKFYEKGIAYRRYSPVDFCPSCNTTLAREQVWGEDRHCERCNTPVIKKELNQWFFKITDYADELLDFSKIEWPERVITMQQNWIGRSEGAEVVFHTEAGQPIKIFTTRPDTLWGVTFMVLAPEHPLVAQITTPDQRDLVNEYVAQAGRQSEIERLATTKEKTGVFTGAYAINPVNGERVPIWIADYVMMGYGTGAIMAVPAHDERDFAFATKYQLPVKIVIAPPGWSGSEPLSSAYTGVEEGLLVNSGQFNGTLAQDAKSLVTRWLEEKGLGTKAVNYRLRDWLISRQRYWGAPIPIVYCEKCGTVPVPEKDLPVLLPEDAEFLPTGESPLRYHEGFRKTTCPKCGGPAERETDTMDTFMCSSWYQYAYLSPYYQGDIPFDRKEAEYWLPVDMYTGGVEHACMHLIYTRFFTKAMRDLGLVNFDEPMLRLRNQGIILGEDSEKMSKSRGNVVAPDDLVQKYGADAVRTYLMFGWRWEQGGPWDSRGAEGMYRFMNRIWDLTLEPVSPNQNEESAKILRRKTHQTIAKATRDLEGFSFNTYIAALMEFSNVMAKYKADTYGSEAWNEAVQAILLLLAPAAPHITEEIWNRLGLGYSIHSQKWPESNPELAAEETVEIVLQVNGKIREKVVVAVGSSEAELREIGVNHPTIVKATEGKTVKKVIIVPGRLINIVIV
ncbi:leucyl-tRNA synthetase [Hydrogenispora ethanolica]|uniref:Leucine--tRNA ligase n=1 Tax=Hydrogenispora ethanolica TaxID=1082276 RepID=A0A4R1QUE4_HYDET|nr:leucine--tRNA ligase [Hydrogenispora ethanolica]TCL57117.1 leucyl-tRNA synthetase [Hydrogenispora ethanolica]